MNPDELISNDPSAVELSDRANALKVDPAEEARVREKLERARAPAQTIGSAFPPFLEAARQKLDVRYADAPSSERPLIGPALIAAKRAFRLVGQPFINEALRKQVEFNQLILSGIAQVYELLQQQARAQALFRDEVRERLAKLEARRPRSQA